MIKIFAVFFLVFTVFFHLAADEHWFAEKISKTLVTRQGRTVDAGRALKGKKVAVYFSASWCGPCRAFTPKLVNFYNAVAKKKTLEIVFVSSDRNEKAMKQYMRHASMPWLADRKAHV